jgi:flotillin
MALEGLYFAGGAFVLLMGLVAAIKSRYKKFTSREFVLRFRNGKLINRGYGGGYFLLPLIDELVILSTTVQNLEIKANELISAENQDIAVSGFVVWRIEDPESAYQSISGSQNLGVMTELNKILEDLTESIIRTTVATLTLDQVLRERSLIIEAIMTELVPVVAPMGIKINTAEIRHVEVLDQELFNDLQEKYRQSARLKAEQDKIQTEREVARTRAESEQVIRERELERDRAVLVERQKVEETEEKRRIAVEQLQKTRETKIADLTKQRLEIEAKTKLMEIEFEAESNKRRQLLEQIDIEAEKEMRMANAKAEAIKLEASARKEAAEMDAYAEAVKLREVAKAKREALMAEAEGRKAILLAEAEGLREKVKAQGLVNDAMIMQDLVKQLPSIASSMKVGDINWLNMGGGNGENGDSPLGIIPKNMLQVMALSKSFGLDVENLIRSIRGKDPLPTIQAQANTDGNTEFMPVEYTGDMLSNATAVYANGELIGFDTDGDGDVDFRVPDGVHVVLDKKGRIKGFDLDGDGESDFNLPKDLIAYDRDGDGTIDALDLDGDGHPDINLMDLLAVST